MLTPDARHEFAGLENKLSLEKYNYAHFRATHYLLDVLGTITARGVNPGETAPDFELPRVEGGRLRLSELRGKPVLLHFGSTT